MDKKWLDMYDPRLREYYATAGVSTRWSKEAIRPTAFLRVLAGRLVSN